MLKKPDRLDDFADTESAKKEIDDAAKAVTEAEEELNTVDTSDPNIKESVDAAKEEVSDVGETAEQVQKQTDEVLDKQSQNAKIKAATEEVTETYQGKSFEQERSEWVAAMKLYNAYNKDNDTDGYKEALKFINENKGATAEDFLKANFNGKVPTIPIDEKNSISFEEYAAYQGAINNKEYTGEFDQEEHDKWVAAMKEYKKIYPDGDAYKAALSFINDKKTKLSSSERTPENFIKTTLVEYVNKYKNALIGDSDNSGNVAISTDSEIIVNDGSKGRNIPQRKLTKSSDKKKTSASSNISSNLTEHIKIISGKSLIGTSEADGDKVTVKDVSLDTSDKGGNNLEAVSEAKATINGLVANKVLGNDVTSLSLHDVDPVSTINTTIAQNGDKKETTIQEALNSKVNGMLSTDVLVKNTINPLLHATTMVKPTPGVSDTNKEQQIKKIDEQVERLQEGIDEILKNQNATSLSDQAKYFLNQNQTEIDKLKEEKAKILVKQSNNPETAIGIINIGNTASEVLNRGTEEAVDLSEEEIEAKKDLLITKVPTEEKGAFTPNEVKLNLPKGLDINGINVQLRPFTQDNEITVKVERGPLKKNPVIKIVEDNANKNLETKTIYHGAGPLNTALFNESEKLMQDLEGNIPEGYESFGSKLKKQEERTKIFDLTMEIASLAANNNEESGNNKLADCINEILNQRKNNYQVDTTLELGSQGFVFQDTQRIVEGKIKVEALVDEIIRDFKTGDKDKQQRYIRLKENQSENFEGFRYSYGETKSKLDELEAQKKEVETLKSHLGEEDSEYDISLMADYDSQIKDLNLQIIELTNQINAYGETEIDFKNMFDVRSAIDKSSSKIEGQKEELRSLQNEVCGIKGAADSLEKFVYKLQNGESFEDAEEMIVAYRTIDSTNTETYDFDTMSHQLLGEKGVPVTYKELYGDSEFTKQLREKLTFDEKGNLIFDENFLSFYTETLDKLRTYDTTGTENQIVALQKEMNKEAEKLLVYQSIESDVKESVQYSLEHIDRYLLKDDFKDKSEFTGDYSVLDNYNGMDGKYQEMLESDDNKLPSKQQSRLDELEARKEELQMQYQNVSKSAGGMTYSKELDGIQQEIDNIETEIQNIKAIPTKAEKAYAGEVLAYIVNSSSNPDDSNYMRNGYAETLIYPGIEELEWTSDFKELAINYNDKWRDIMTDAEKKVFNYVCNTEGYAKGFEYLKEISANLDSRYVANERSKDSKYAHEHPILASIGSVFKKPIEGIGSAIYAFGSLLNGTPIQKNRIYSSADTMRSTVSQDIKTLHGDASSFMYDTTMSISDTGLTIVLNAATGGTMTFAVTTGVMGSSVFNTTLNDAINRGLDDTHAITLATFSAIVEGAMESYSLSHLVGMEQSFEEIIKSDGVVGKALNNTINKLAAKGITGTTAINLVGFGYSLISQSLVEGDEELCTELLNSLGDYYISGDLSQSAKVVEEYKKSHPGCSEAEANMAGLNDLAGNWARAYIGGVVSGSIFGSGGSLKSIASNNYYSDYLNAYIDKNIIRRNSPTMSVVSASDYATPTVNQGVDVQEEVEKLDDVKVESAQKGVNPVVQSEKANVDGEKNAVGNGVSVETVVNGENNTDIKLIPIEITKRVREALKDQGVDTAKIAKAAIDKKGHVVVTMRNGKIYSYSSDGMHFDYATSVVNNNQSNNVTSSTTQGVEVQDVNQHSSGNRTLQDISSLLQDERYFILGHGTGRSTDVVIPQILEQGLRVKNNNLFDTADGLNTNNLTGLQEQLDNWRHLNSDKIVLIRLPIEYITSKIQDDIGGSKFGAFYNEVIQDNGKVQFYLDPKFIIGVYDSKTNTVQMNDKFEKELSTESIKKLKLQYEMQMKENEEAKAKLEEGPFHIGEASENHELSESIGDFNFDESWLDEDIDWDDGQNTKTSEQAVMEHQEKIEELLLDEQDLSLEKDIDANMEIIDVSEINTDKQRKNTSKIQLGKMGVDPNIMNMSYKSYDYVYKTSGDVNIAIKQILSQNKKGKILLELDNTKGLTKENLSLLPGNVEIRVLGDYGLENFKGFTADESALHSLENVTYTVSEMQKIMTIIGEFEAGINPNWNDATKAKYAYDYVTNNIRYRGDTGQDDLRGGNKARPSHYDGLTNLIVKKSTCQGFAHTYKELLARMEIPCYEISGRLGLKGQHAFNVVTIDGENIIVDTTRNKFADFYEDLLYYPERIKFKPLTLETEETYQKKIKESKEKNPGTGFGVENIREYNFTSNRDLKDTITTLKSVSYTGQQSRLSDTTQILENKNVSNKETSPLMRDATENKGAKSIISQAVALGTESNGESNLEVKLMPIEVKPRIQSGSKDGVIVLKEDEYSISEPKVDALMSGDSFQQQVSLKEEKENEVIPSDENKVVKSVAGQVVSLEKEANDDLQKEDTKKTNNETDKPLSIIDEEKKTYSFRPLSSRSMELDILMGKVKLDGDNVSNIVNRINNKFSISLEDYAILKRKGALNVVGSNGFGNFVEITDENGEKTEYQVEKSIFEELEARYNRDIIGKNEKKQEELIDDVKVDITPKGVNPVVQSEKANIDGAKSEVSPSNDIKQVTDKVIQDTTEESKTESNYGQLVLNRTNPFKIGELVGNDEVVERNLNGIKTSYSYDEIMSFKNGEHLDAKSFFWYLVQNGRLNEDTDLGDFLAAIAAHGIDGITLNTGAVVDVNDIEDKQQAAKEFAEGNPALEKLLLDCWSKDLSTRGCCAGHEPNEYSSGNTPYILFNIRTSDDIQLYNKLKEALGDKYDPTYFPENPIMNIGPGFAFYDVKRTNQMFEEINRVINAIYLQKNIPSELWNVDDIPEPKNPKIQSGLRKIAAGENLTIDEQLALEGRDTVVKEIDGYKLKPDHVYRAISLEAYNAYAKSGKITRWDMPDFVEGENNGGVDWYLGGYAPRYGEIVIEAPADKKYFVPANNSGIGMAKDISVRHMKSSSQANPLPFSMIKVVKGMDIINEQNKIKSRVSRRIERNSSKNKLDFSLNKLNPFKGFNFATKLGEVFTDTKEKGERASSAKKSVVLDVTDGNYAVSNTSKEMEQLNVNEENENLIIKSKTQSPFETIDDVVKIMKSMGQAYVLEILENYLTKGDIEYFTRRYGVRDVVQTLSKKDIKEYLEKNSILDSNIEELGLRVEKFLGYLNPDILTKEYLNKLQDDARIVQNQLIKLGDISSLEERSLKFEELEFLLKNCESSYEKYKKSFSEEQMFELIDEMIALMQKNGYYNGYEALQRYLEEGDVTYLTSKDDVRKKIDNLPKNIIKKYLDNYYSDGQIIELTNGGFLKFMKDNPNIDVNKVYIFYVNGIKIEASINEIKQYYDGLTNKLMILPLLKDLYEQKRLSLSKAQTLQNYYFDYGDIWAKFSIEEYSMFEDKKGNFNFLGFYKYLYDKNRLDDVNLNKKTIKKIDDVVANNISIKEIMGFYKNGVFDKILFVKYLYDSHKYAEGNFQNTKTTFNHNGIQIFCTPSDVMKFFRNGIFDENSFVIYSVENRLLPYNSNYHINMNVGGNSISCTLDDIKACVKNSKFSLVDFIDLMIKQGKLSSSDSRLNYYNINGIDVKTSMQEIALAKSKYKTFDGKFDVVGFIKHLNDIGRFSENEVKRINDFNIDGIEMQCSIEELLRFYLNIKTKFNYYNNDKLDRKGLFEYLYNNGRISESDYFEQVIVNDLNKLNKIIVASKYSKKFFEKYGSVDQNGLATVDVIERERLIQFAMGKYDLSRRDVEIIMRSANLEGACTYANMCNIIYELYHFDAQKFEEDFNYPLLSRDGELNGNQLLLDLYIFQNISDDDSTLILRDKDTGKLHINSKLFSASGTTIDVKKQKYMSDFFNGLDLKAMSRFLEYNNSQVKYEGYYNRNIDLNSLSAQQTIEDAIKRNKIIMMGVYGGTELHPINIQKPIMVIRNNEGHAVTPVAITYNGILVRSWKDLYYIPNDTLDGSISIIENIDNLGVQQNKSVAFEKEQTIIEEQTLLNGIKQTYNPQRKNSKKIIDDFKNRMQNEIIDVYDNSDGTYTIVTIYEKEIVANIDELSNPRLESVIKELNDNQEYIYESNRLTSENAVSGITRIENYGNGKYFVTTDFGDTLLINSSLYNSNELANIVSQMNSLHSLINEDVESISYENGYFTIRTCFGREYQYYGLSQEVIDDIVAKNDDVINAKNLVKNNNKKTYFDSDRRKHELVGSPFYDSDDDTYYFNGMHSLESLKEGALDGTIIFSNMFTHSDGVIDVFDMVVFDDSGQPYNIIRKKTFFPESWSDEMIISNVLKVGDSEAIGVEYDTIDINKYYTFHYGIIDGVPIGVIKNPNGSVRTAYPMYKWPNNFLDIRYISRPRNGGEPII